MTKSILAFDKSMRHKDVDGKLYVDLSPISKACVSPYFGKEIPDYQTLGLEPEKVYFLLRDPLELAKAAPSFRGLPILILHKASTADDHPQELTVGAVGTEVEFNDPYLEAPLCIWTDEAIVGIETKEQTEISSGYRYRADMTPGEYKGERYDGVMRDIHGNHIALVDVGRAGPDVVVMDEKPFNLRGNKMAKLTTKGALVAGTVRAFLSPRLATDAAIGSLAAQFADVKAGKLSDQIPAIVKTVKAMTKGKLATDAKIDGLDAELAKLAKNEDGEMGKDDMDEELATDGEEDDEEEKKKKAKAKEGAKDADEPKKEDDDKVSKGAMDAAIAASVKLTTDRINALHEARKAVHPLVGDVTMDSADDVYKFALDHLGVDTKNVHASAYPALLKLASAPKPTNNAIALDKASVAALTTSLQATRRVKHI